MKIRKTLSVAMSKSSEEWKHEIIRSKQDLKEWLACEKNNYSKDLSFFEGRPICLTEKDFIWKYQVRLRKTEYYVNTNKIIRYIISRIILMRMSAKYGMQVRINSCGKGFRIVHISSVITSGDIGEYYTAFPNTLIGEGTRGGNPVLGNHVTAYPGAIVVGDIEIADNVSIGANSFVNESFLEQGATIVGAPARIVKR